MSGEQERTITGGRIHVDGEVQIDFPSDVKTETTAAQGRTETRERKKLKIEFWTLIVVGIYALLTLWLSWSTQALVNVTKDQFTKDQRPYIWYTHIDIDPPAIGKKITAMVTFRNVGKSPALKLWIPEVDILYGANAETLADKYFEIFQRYKVVRSHPEYSSVLLFPESPADQNTYLRHPAASADDLTAEEAQWISNHANSLYIVGKVFYEDMAGNTYHSDFCVMTGKGGEFANCRNHNDIN